ncbi:MAG: hypothetical protein LAO19_08000 [Acidobacteriia bacterium]|nr:hypothetical protein [Terriglobia bacterium]
MRIHSFGWVLALTALASTPVLFSQSAQRRANAKPAAASAVSDFSGVWFIRKYSRSILPKEDPPLQPEAEKLFQQRVYDNSHHDPDQSVDPTEKCIPPGVPRTMLQPFPWEIVQAPGRIVIIYEYQAIPRQIFMDGRAHPADLEPTYMGHSIGKYEGDTLVIDTVGLNDKTWLDPMGLPHSDAMHVIERLRRTDRDTLVDDVTIDDPKTYTKPWTAQITFKLHTDWQIQEYVCAENNRSK